MIEFNPDGSIKMPGKLGALKAEQEAKMKGRCLHVRKEIVSDRAPKACALHIRVSDAVTDMRFVENIYLEWSSQSEVPSSLRKDGEKEYHVKIGTHFRRCSDCSRLLGKYRGFIQMIEDKGGCTFNPSGNFCYEDYFD